MKEIIDDFKTLIKNSTKITKLMNAYDKTKENPVDNAYLLEKKIGEIERVITNLPEFELTASLKIWVQQEKKAIEKAKEDFRFKFGQELKKLLENDDKQMRGQYPLLRVGFYTLKLDFEFGNAILYFGQEVEKLKSKIPLQPETIFKTIKKYDDALRKVKFNPEEIFKDIYQAYKNRLTLMNKSFGEKLLLTEVLGEFVILKQSKNFFIDPKRENYKEYSRVTLSYLLYLLKESNLYQRGMRLHVATFDATVNKLHSLWIPDNDKGNGTYYSYISFEKI